MHQTLKCSREISKIQPTKTISKTVSQEKHIKKALGPILLNQFIDKLQYAHQHHYIQKKITSPSLQSFPIPQCRSIQQRATVPTIIKVFIHKHYIQNINNYLFQLKTINRPQKMQHSHITHETQSNEQFSIAEEESFDDDDYYSLKRKHYIKKSKIRLRKKKNNGIKCLHNQSLWNIHENRIYMKFLIQKGHLFNSNSIQRKAIKINVQMNEAIKTRSADQCRSHHQKMMKHHKDIPHIIEHIQTLIQKHKKPTYEKSQPFGSRTYISLKDLSHFEPTSEGEQSIWNQLLNNLSGESQEVDRHADNQELYFQFSQVKDPDPSQMLSQLA